MAPTAHRPLTALLAVVAALVTALLSAPAAHAIANGQAVAAGEFPFVAEVHNGTELCTGTLVDPSYVLTASHCTPTGYPSGVTVRVGDTTYGTGGEVRTVDAIRHDPGYTGGHNDVALLHLASPITTIAPVHLAAPDIAYRWDGQGDAGIAIGWGQTVANGPPAGTLQKANVVIKPAVIDGAGIPMIPVTANPGGPCLGDSGGPMLVRNPQNELVQMGVLKAAYMSCNGNGDYSEVGAGPNRDWLLSRLARYTSFGAADYDRDGKPDLVLRDNANGELDLFPGRGAITGFEAPIPISAGFVDASPFGLADWDGNGTVDVIARDDDTGDLVMWSGPGTRSRLGTTARIGNGWGMATSFGTADWNGDGRPDIVEREDASGDLKMFPSVGGPNYPGAPTRIGNGWRNETSFGLGDWDRNGTTDVIERDDSTGNLRMFEGPGRAAYPVSVTQIGNGWAPATSFGIADWNVDGKQDIVTERDASGDLWYFPGRGVAGYPDPPVLLAHGF